MNQRIQVKGMEVKTRVPRSGFRPIGFADLLGRLPEGVGQEASF
jgi:hypothetical protein